MSFIRVLTILAMMALARNPLLCLDSCYKSNSSQLQNIWAPNLLKLIGQNFGWSVWLITWLGLMAVFSGYCPLARMLSLLPLNQNAPLSCDSVKQVSLSPR